MREIFFCLQTGVNGLFSPTQLALDFATPVKGAIASLDDDDLLSAVAPTAAHEVAPVHPDAGVVALPTVRPHDSEFGISLAEWRRRFQINEILCSRRFVLGVVGFQLKVVTLPSGQTFALRVDGIAGAVADYGVAETAHSVRVADHHSGCAIEAVF